MRPRTAGDLVVESAMLEVEKLKAELAASRTRITKMEKFIRALSDEREALLAALQVATEREQQER